MNIFHLPSFVLLLVLAFFPYPQESALNNGLKSTEQSLPEIASCRRILLVVSKTSTIDSRDLDKTVLAESYKVASEGRFRYKYTYNTIARKLNSYIKKHRSLAFATSAAEVEVIVFFNLLTYKRILGRPYPFGELFVIANDESEKEKARIVWRSSKVQAAEDAISDFIKGLKTVRGER